MHVTVLVKTQKYLSFTFSSPVSFTPSLNLKPLHFEIPGLSSDWLFTGREWLFQEVDACLRSSDPATSRGVVIVGNMGFGKTAIIARLVALCCHGNRLWLQAAGNQTMPKSKLRDESLERLMINLTGLYFRVVCPILLNMIV